MKDTMLLIFVICFPVVGMLAVLALYARHACPGC